MKSLRKNIFSFPYSCGQIPKPTFNMHFKLKLGLNCVFYAYLWVFWFANGQNRGYQGSEWQGPPIYYKFLKDFQNELKIMLLKISLLCWCWIIRLKRHFVWSDCDICTTCKIGTCPRKFCEDCLGKGHKDRRQSYKWNLVLKLVLNTLAVLYFN